MNSIKRSYYSIIARDNICVKIRDEKRLVIIQFLLVSNFMVYH